MGRSVPAANRVLGVLRLLATHARPIGAGMIARELEIPRSSLYHLLAVMEKERFVVYFPEERRYGLGVAAVELGSAYLRQVHVERLARPLLVSLVAAVGATAHLAILDGREVIYLLEQRPPTPPPLVTDVGVRLPAHLTASGRAILAYMPPAHAQALYPTSSDFTRRTASGPGSPRALRRLLTAARNRGFALEDGEVSAGYRSAAMAVFDHGQRPTAAVAVTVASSDDEPEAALERLVPAIRIATTALTKRLGGEIPDVGVG